MHIGLGDCVEFANDGSCLVDDGVTASSVCLPSDPTSAACSVPGAIATGASLPVNPLTGQPSSSLALISNTLSNNSQLIVAGAAIIGVLISLSGGKGRR